MTPMTLIRTDLFNASFIRINPCHRCHQWPKNRLEFDCKKKQFENNFFK